MIQPSFTRIPAQELFDHIGQLLDEGYEAAFTVTGNSMWPLLRHGRDRVVLENCKNNPIKKGDVVLFSPAPGRYLLHRVDWRQGALLRTSGDGNNYRDGTFPDRCVIGKAVSFVRKGKVISCKQISYRMYSCVWLALFRFRPLLLHILRKLAALRTGRHKN